MSFSLSARSRTRLLGVHPDLVRVVERAITITLVDFSVVEGLRTLAKQAEYFKKGKSMTMNSRHLTGHAVDLAPWMMVDGKMTIDWESEAGWEAVADAMKSSAYALNVPLTWGGDWRRFVDKPHFELSRDVYPA
jgi:peptidoglycan L-alanyl-D-glutamate endopeptidase CwlK